MITRLASTMRDEFSSIIRTFTSSTVSEANEAALAIINRLVAEKSRTEAENIAIPPEVVEAAAKAAWKIYWPAIEWESLGNTRLAEMFREMATAALAALPAPSPWRPIETAPKDGTRLLLAYQTIYQKWRRVVAFYAPKFAIEGNDDGSDWCEYDEANDRYCLPEGWYECIENWDDYSSVHMSGVEPTHWMPLPPAPKEVE